jgi:hypothetical protein
MMMYHWVLNPGVIVSIVGNSYDDLDLDPHHLQAIERGIATFAANANACLITGGIGLGVSKLVGGALRRFAADVDIPCVGICSWGTVKGKDMLLASEPGTPNSSARERRYHIRQAERSDENGGWLETSHTHFVMVDPRNGTSGRRAWGVEKTTRQRCIKALVSLMNIPVVTLVMGGGLGTLDTVCSALKMDTPIVVVEGSGGVADALILFESEGNFMHCRDFFSEILPPARKSEELNRLQKLLQRARKDGLISTFTIPQMAKSDIDEVLMKSLLTRLEFTPLKKLSLAMKWNRVEVIEEILDKHKRFRSLYRNFLDYCLRKAILWRRANLVEIILARGFEISRSYGQSMDSGLRVSLSELYSINGPNAMSKRFQTTILNEMQEDLRAKHSMVSPSAGHSLTAVMAARRGASAWRKKTKQNKETLGEEDEVEKADKSWSCVLCVGRNGSEASSNICQTCQAPRRFEVIPPASITNMIYADPTAWRLQQKLRDVAAATPTGAATPVERRGRRRSVSFTLGVKANLTIGSPGSLTPDMVAATGHLYYPEVVVHKLQEYLPHFSEYVRNRRSTITPLDLLLWACCMQETTLAEIFWRQCKAPVEAGLIASLWCKCLSHSAADDDRQLANLDALGSRMEACAKSVLGMCESAEGAGRILRRKSIDWFRNGVAMTTMELALLQREAAIEQPSSEGASEFLALGTTGDDSDDEELASIQQQFLGHPYCGKLLDAVWCGDFLPCDASDGLANYLLLLCQSFWPFNQLVPLSPGASWDYPRFLSVPKVKFVLFYASYIAFLAFYIFVLARRAEALCGVEDLMLTLWAFGLSINEALDCRGSEKYWEDHWNKVDATLLGIIHVVICVRITVFTQFFPCGVAYLFLTYFILNTKLPSIRAVRAIHRCLDITVIRNPRHIGAFKHR